MQKNVVQYAVGDLSFSGQETNLATKNAGTGALIANGFEIKGYECIPKWLFENYYVQED
jgi:hypothetical protein